VWDARTTSMLVLLFLYFGVIALRQAVPREETAGRAAAILAVVGMVDIPIIKYSVDWWLTAAPDVDVQTDVGTVDGRPRCICRCSSACWASTRSSSACCLFGVGNEVLMREQRTQWVSDLVRSRQS
jgi:heme exporter protein C